MKRRTTGLQDEEAGLVANYATPGTPAHQALGSLVPEVPVHSESSAIRALLVAGHRAVVEERLRLGYDRAVAAGEIDAATLAWHEGAARQAAALWGGE